jgi:exoribonuclease R
MACQVKEDNYPIGKNRLAKLAFSTIDPSNQLVWTKAGKEFIYKNEMYDVVKIDSNLDDVSYYCIKDKDENNLVDTFITLLTNSLGNDKKNQNDHTKELSKYNVAVKNNPGVTRIIDIIYPTITLSYKSLPKTIDSPPPRFA